MLCLLKVMEGWTFTVWKKPYLVCSQVRHLRGFQQLSQSERESGNRAQKWAQHEPCACGASERWSGSRSTVGPPHPPSQTTFSMPFASREL